MLKHKIVETCPAKVNLFLQATEKRADGYHNLVSLVGFTKFADTLEITISQQDNLSLSGPYADRLIAAGGDSIISRLLHSLRSAGYDIPSLDIHLEKHIPLGGGLGGGSADGAGFLRGLVSLGVIDKADRNIYKYASMIGADLAICITPSFQIMRGTGTDIEPIPSPSDQVYCVLANPEQGLATHAVFGALAEHAFFTGRLDTAEIAQMLAARHWQDIIGIGNNLTEAAISLCPEIGSLIDEMRQFGAQNFGAQFLGAAMSGSGSSCFALFSHKSAADALALHLKGRNFWAQSTELINHKFF